MAPLRVAVPDPALSSRVEPDDTPHVPVELCRSLTVRVPLPFTCTLPLLVTGPLEKLSVPEVTVTDPLLVKVRPLPIIEDPVDCNVPLLLKRLLEPVL